MNTWTNNRDVFEYTSGRFLFNEHLRRAERRLRFDVDALAKAVCHSVSRPVGSLASITKLVEGGFNRVLQATFDDGYAVIARLPYNTTVPKCHAVASEAATLGFLHSYGVPVPKVLAYSPDRTNPVGAEYTLLEKIEGTPLSDQWFTMDNKTRVRIMRQIIDVEKRFMAIAFLANGSLYYRRDLGVSQLAIPLPGQPEVSGANRIVIGPTVQHEWWYQERALLDVDRGPCIFFPPGLQTLSACTQVLTTSLGNIFTSCFEAPAKREMEFGRRFGKPRLHVERYLRELHQFKEMSPTVHIQLLSDFLGIAPYLDISPDHLFSRPTLRHPDFSSSNILINSSNDIVGIIDWQHAVVLPLCLCAGIPAYFQNWGDPLSETLAKPEVRLLENFDDLSQDEQSTVQETLLKRLVHFYYAALTMKEILDHFDTLRNENSMLRAKLFNRAGAPWEGDSLSLKYTITQIFKNWLIHFNDVAPVKSVDCLLKYSEDEIQQCTRDYEQEQEKMQELTKMKDIINTDALGWVPDNEQLEKSRAIIWAIKEGLVEHSKTEDERTAVELHFPFDDHNESV